MNTITIKKTVSELKEIEKEISIPFYSKDKDRMLPTYYRITDDEKAISVFFCTDKPIHASITINSYRVADALQGEPCSEEEFFLAYETAKNLIEVEINKELQTV